VIGQTKICQAGVELPGLCSQGCFEAVKQKYGVQPVSCSCKDTPIKLALCSCNYICALVKGRKVLSVPQINN